MTDNSIARSLGGVYRKLTSPKILWSAIAITMIMLLCMILANLIDGHNGLSYSEMFMYSLMTFNGGLWGAYFNDNLRYQEEVVVDD